VAALPLLCAGPVWADGLGGQAGDGRDGAAAEDASTERRPPWKTRRESKVNFEFGFDTNARRASSDTATFLLTPDLLAYLFGTTEWVAARPGRSFRAGIEVGGKLFLDTGAENLVAGRLKLAFDRRLARRWVATSSASYQDKFQKGDDPDVVVGTELACSSQGSIDAKARRCNARDYRMASLEGGVDLLLSRAATIRARLGLSALDYKPSRQFSFLAPRVETDLRLRLSLRHRLSVGLETQARFYHPDSVTWQLLPSGSGTVVLPVDTARREWAPALRLGWAYRGRVLVSVNGAVARTVNNSFGLDAWRLRLDGSLALRLRRGTHLVLTAAVQSSIYPEGNVLRGLSLVGEESERQNSFTFRFSQALGEVLSLLLKVQIYANELSGQVLPFRRLVVQLGFGSRF